MGCCGSRPLGDAEEEAAVQAYEKYQTSKDLRDLQSAIVHYREATEARQSLPDKYAVTAITLANTIWQHYELTGKPKAELDEVISRFRGALNIWKKEEPKPDDYPTLLVNLGNAYRDLFDKDDTDETLGQSIQYYESARAFKNSHPKKYAEATLMLGTMLWTRCEKQDHDRRLKDAINYLKEAHRRFDGEPPAALCVYNLAGAYLTLSTKRSATSEDIDFAIENYQAAVDLYRPNDPHHGLALYNLSQALIRRYNSKREASDLKGAKKYATSAKKAVSDDLRPELDKILEFVKSETETVRLEVPNTTAKKPKKRSKANLFTSAQAAPGAPVLGQNISHANTFSDTDSQTAKSTPVDQKLSPTFYNRDPNSSNVTRNSSQGTSWHRSTDNLRTSVSAGPDEIPLVNVTPASSGPARTREGDDHTKNAASIIEQSSTTAAFNGRDPQKSNGLYPVGQNASKQRSRDDLLATTQALSNHSYPSEPSDAHRSFQGTARHKSKDHLRTTQAVPAEVPLVDYFASSGLTNEKNARDPISTASFYNRNANGSTVNHPSSQDSSRRTSKDNLRDPPQPAATELSVVNDSVAPSSWNEKNTRTQQSAGQWTPGQNSKGSLHAPIQRQATASTVYHSLAPSASVNSQNERGSQTRSITTAATYNGNSNRSDDTRLFGQGSSGMEASGSGAIHRSSSKLSNSGSKYTPDHAVAPEYPVNGHSPAPSDPTSRWNGRESQPQKMVAVEQGSAATSNNRGPNQLHKHADTLRPTTQVTPGGYYESANQATPATEPRYPDPQRMDGVHSASQRSYGHKSKDNLRADPQPRSNDHSRFD